VKPAMVHGGRLDAAIASFGGRRADWLDLSTGINPAAWPVPPIPTECWTRLPDCAATIALIGAARSGYGVANGAEIVAAPGTQALIELLPRILPGKSAAIVAPRAGTYGEYAHCCAKAGRRVRVVDSPDRIEPDDSLAILANPNNPDGRIWSQASISGMARRTGSAGGHVIVDEAFCDCYPQASLLASLPENAVVLRSFGKFFGLAGLRLGFAACHPPIARQIERHLGPWAISGPALEIGARALRDGKWIARARSSLQSRSSRLAEILDGRGFELAGLNALFVLVSHPGATGIAEALMQRQVLVREFPDRRQYLRFGVPAGETELRRLQVALEELAKA
jgi:cobalamin biosynthesis protein CobC